MIKRLKNTKETVDGYLRNYPHTRDSDEKLIANIWAVEACRLFDLRDTSQLQDISASDFLAELSNGKFTSSEAITRCRRKLQEENPELRGKTYAERHKKEEEILHELGYGNNN